MRHACRRRAGHGPDDECRQARRRRWRSRAGCSSGAGWAFGLCVAILEPLLLPLTKRRWMGGENIPATGGCVAGRQPRLPRSTRSPSRTSSTTTAGCRGSWPRPSCSTYPVLGAHRAQRRQIPVYRLTTDASRCVRAPRSRRCSDGECVVVYPEGTITREPDLWPMTGKTGAARIALAHRLPGDPGRRSGARSDILAPYAKRPRPVPAQDDHDEGRRPGRPRRPARPAAHRRRCCSEATDRIMDALTALRRGHPRRAGAGRAVRPAQRPACARPATRTSRASSRRSEAEPDDDARSRCSAPGPGARRSRWCSPTPATT